MNLEQLNDRQKEAVLYNEGPLLIIAGAGAGKTKTLTTKIAFLIEEKNVNPADFKLTNIQLGEGSPLLGHTSASASLRNKYSALVVAIQRGDEYLKPNGEVAFMPQDIVWMVGDVKRLAELR